MQFCEVKFYSVRSRSEAYVKLPGNNWVDLSADPPSPSPPPPPSLPYSTHSPAQPHILRRPGWWGVCVGGKEGESGRARGRRREERRHHRDLADKFSSSREWKNWQKELWKQMTCSLAWKILLSALTTARCRRNRQDTGDLSGSISRPYNNQWPGLIPPSQAARFSVRGLRRRRDERHESELFRLRPIGGGVRWIIVFNESLTVLIGEV